jgi:hypothetical protein
MPYLARIQCIVIITSIYQVPVPACSRTETRTIQFEHIQRLHGGNEELERSESAQRTTSAFERGRLAAEAVDPGIISRMNVEQIQRLFAEHGAPGLDLKTAQRILHQAKQNEPVDIDGTRTDSEVDESVVTNIKSDEQHVSCPFSTPFLFRSVISLHVRSRYTSHNPKARSRPRDLAYEGIIRVRPALCQPAAHPA